MTTAPELLCDGRVQLYCGDCLDVLAALEANSIDACVTDSPYGLEFMGKEWDAPWQVSSSSALFGKRQTRLRQMSGFQDWCQDWAREVIRVLKPGGHLLSFGGTRTFHRMACAIEDAGFEIRDAIMWVYGSGFPKSHDVSKGIDRAAGAERERIRGVRSGVVGGVYAQDAWSKEFKDSVLSSEPITDAAREWEGWGTALKPAVEPLVLARKPLSEGTIAANVLKWGTGALNIGGCRVATNDGLNGGAYAGASTLGGGTSYVLKNAIGKEFVQPSGRWPANIVHDGSDEVVGTFPWTASGSGNKNTGNRDNGLTIGNGLGAGIGDGIGGDSGSAARFFYTAKADSDDRLGSKHPTVKPVDLIQWLVRLITPPCGLCLDLFAGTGTTGEACIREGMRAVLIEREAEYQNDIRRRMRLAMSGPDERSREAIKAKLGDKPVDAGPLFSGRMFADIHREAAE